MKFYSKIFVSLRNNFFKGILISVPVFITFYVAWILIKFFDNKVTPVLGPLIPKHLNPSHWSFDRIYFFCNNRIFDNRSFW